MAALDEINAEFDLFKNENSILADPSFLSPSNAFAADSNSFLDSIGLGGAGGEGGFLGDLGGLKGVGDLLGGFGSIGKALLGFKQLDQAEDQFGFTKDAFNRNLSNQAATINDQRSDRRHSRLASAGSDQQRERFRSLEDFNKGRVDGSAIG